MRSQSYVGVVLLIGIIACASLGIAIAGDEEMCVPMGIITLEPPDSVEAKRSAVEFQHSRHFVKACNACHHTWEFTEPITGCMTAGCHDLDTLPRKEDSKAIDKDQAFRFYKNAYHGKCIGCHKTMKQEIQQMATTLAGIDGKLPTTGPTGCIECHPKE
ncbi:MAG: cytochrome c3 family protein [Deltaproteobacteria bacterium]|nr:cytochrome c3 family protein [Deltaproteobacteria bacterium]